MNEFVFGPVYCPICIDVDIKNSPTMSYSIDGNGWCDKCGYRYKAGTKWVLTEKDLKDLEEEFK